VRRLLVEAGVSVADVGVDVEGGSIGKMALDKPGVKEGMDVDT
jgi:hypothetical protein